MVVPDTRNADRHLDYRQRLRKYLPDFEEGRYGEISVFVVPFEVGATADIDELNPFLILSTDGFNDHRLEDTNTLEAVFCLFSATIEAIDND